MLLVARNRFWPIWGQQWGPHRSWNPSEHFWSFHFLNNYKYTIVKTSSNDFIEHNISKFHLFKIAFTHFTLPIEKYIRSPNFHLDVVRKRAWLDSERVDWSIREYLLVDVVFFSWKVDFLENLKSLFRIGKVFLEVKCIKLLDSLVNSLQNVH